ncbi:DUF1523 family protein [Dinoroseobacter sp. PD6]|uniref:DUF1523 family protein n=1 Tax=Dinoroseobacter sp. PD6 TaxID=3028384 RepID=UPI00237AF67F|nr:DUF1523 family protein [Dinoroseobacter sp. PD6]MDD9716807.1 DUF1523 family protein [Dinoroseobacter sp. PD6]
MFWTYLRWTLKLTLLVLIGGLLHYVLPQHDVVRIVDAYERRIDFTDNNRIFWAQPDSGAPVADNRDVRFIDAVRPNGKQIVYRNEDTNWSWPFYFKFDSSDLNAAAKDLVSTAEEPTWVIIRHYGWRSNFFSIFPNAVHLTVTDTPDPRIIPWFNIAFFLVLALIGLRIWRWWVNFHEDRIEPLVDDVVIAMHRAEDKADRTGGRVARWWDRVRGRA